MEGRSEVGGRGQRRVELKLLTNTFMSMVSVSLRKAQYSPHSFLPNVRKRSPFSDSTCPWEFWDLCLSLQAPIFFVFSTHP